jgi:HAD superfamily hydrolase (TIGR01484 family)
VEEINDALDKVIVEKKDGQIENRGSQISFSALGQNADLEIKKTWDPDAKKRTIIADKLRPLLPDCEVTVAGTTTIDITRKGVNKAYAIERIKKYLGISNNDILFFGDAIFPGGNDEPVAKMGVESIKVSGPEDTGNHFAELLKPKM